MNALKVIQAVKEGLDLMKIDLIREPDVSEFNQELVFEISNPEMLYSE